MQMIHYRGEQTRKWYKDLFKRSSGWSTNLWNKTWLFLTATSLFGRGERHCTTTQKPSAWLWTMVECIILELLWYLGIWTCNHHQGTMNWKLHEEILQGNFRAAVHGLKFRRGGLMSQDNKPKDTCVSTTEWLKAKNLIFSYSCFFDLPSHYFSENRLWAEA